MAGLLAMLESSSDWKGKGHSLGYCITTELQLWIKEHPAVPQVRKRKARGLEERREQLILMFLKYLQFHFIPKSSSFSVALYRV